MGVDLRKFLKKIDKDGWEMFGNRAGSPAWKICRRWASIDEHHDKQRFYLQPVISLR
ncbi:MAG: hypothetical protein MZV70_27385 [Desulfobacterales bacterium]|nr:hypothetical protein [Desulfobacterales bacterium]